MSDTTNFTPFCPIFGVIFRRLVSHLTPRAPLWCYACTTLVSPPFVQLNTTFCSVELNDSFELNSRFRVLLNWKLTFFVIAIFANWAQALWISGNVFWKNGKAKCLKSVKKICLDFWWNWNGYIFGRREKFGKKVPLPDEKSENGLNFFERICRLDFWFFLRKFSVNLKLMLEKREASIDGIVCSVWDDRVPEIVFITLV